MSSRRRAFYAICASFAFLFSFSSNARAEFVDIAQEFYDALTTVADLANKAQQAQTDMNFIEKERKDAPRTWPWQVAVQQFESSAQKVTNGHFAINFKDSDYPLPKGDWTVCVTRAVLVQVIDAQLGTLNQGMATLNDLSTKLVAARDEVYQTQKTLVAIQRIYIRLASIAQLHPLLSHYFQETDALDISIKVEPALAKVNNAIRDKKKRVDAAISAVTKARDNLSTNKNTINSLECDLSGRYKSTVEFATMFEDIKKSGAGYTCTWVLPSNFRPISCTIISISSIAHSLIQDTGLENGTRRETFTITPDYRRMDGGGYSLIRQ